MNIDGGAFLRKKLKTTVANIKKKSSTTDFWLGSKYSSWQYCQKMAI